MIVSARQALFFMLDIRTHIDYTAPGGKPFLRSQGLYRFHEILPYAAGEEN